MMRPATSKRLCDSGTATIVREREYSWRMVNPALQSAIEAMSLDERLELVEYIEITVEQSQIEVTDEQKLLVRSRASDLQADPSIGLTRDELDARLGRRWK
jgi:putative addiction module component (TIGR02574 family)